MNSWFYVGLAYAVFFALLGWDMVSGALGHARLRKRLQQARRRAGARERQP